MTEANPTEPRLVLLPGMDGTGWLLETFAAALPPSLRPHIMRYPPDGCGSYEQVAQVLDSSGIDSEPYILLAESFSSVAAIQWAARHPANLKGLVICVGFATPPVRRWLRPISLRLTHVLFAIPRPVFITSRWLAGVDAPAPVVKRLKTVKATIPAATFGARIRAVLRCDARAELAQVQVPILFLHARKDRLICMARLEEMRAIQPRAEFEIYPGPHLLLERHAKEAAERVARFVRERAPAL